MITSILTEMTIAPTYINQLSLNYQIKKLTYYSIIAKISELLDSVYFLEKQTYPNTNRFDTTCTCIILMPLACSDAFKYCFWHPITALRLSLESVLVWAYHIFKISWHSCTSIFCEIYATSPKSKDFLRFIAGAPGIVVNFQWAYDFLFWFLIYWNLNENLQN